MMIYGPMISLRNVSKVFGSGPGAISAVRDVTLDVQKGEVFGIIGHSGAGKSTLIRLLNGLEKPTSGSVTVAGTDIGRASDAALRAVRPRIGMIFQHFNLLWSRTVAGNVALPLRIAGVPRDKAQARVAELVRLVGLEGREAAYPAQLSGGQKQRVGIARALANEPEVLLCDEATSALDPQTTDQILDLLAEVNRRLGLTIVLITHEMHVVRRICSHVAVMEAGRIVEAGPVAEVFSQPQHEVTRRFLRQDGEAGEVTRRLTVNLTDAAGLPGLARQYGITVTIEPGNDPDLLGLSLSGDATAVDRVAAALSHAEALREGA